jgi:hypothetical protein
VKTAKVTRSQEVEVSIPVDIARRQTRITWRRPGLGDGAKGAGAISSPDVQRIVIGRMAVGRHNVQMSIPVHIHQQGIETPLSSLA